MLGPLDTRPCKNRPVVETVTHGQRYYSEIKLAKCVLYGGRDGPMLTQPTLLLEPYGACALAATLPCDT